VILSFKILLVVFALIYFVLVTKMGKGWKRIPLFAPAHQAQRAVSVIIAARNEEHNIERTIQCLLQQQYNRELLEIIIIDDHSTDATADIVRKYTAEGIQLIQLNESDKLNSYKKLAIAKAIAIAKGEIIVTTDADCRMGPQWLSTIIAYMEEQDLFLVSSPVAYHEEKNRFERLQTLEFLYLIGLGAAGIGNGQPTTCNGANLAYRKNIFEELGGFQGIDQLASGDDELFLHKVAEKYPSRIGFCKSRDAIVYTDAKPDLSSFISQRKRWASKSTKYKDKRVVALGVSIWFFNLFLVVNIALAIWAPFQFAPLLCYVLLAKYFAEYQFMRGICNFMRRPELMQYLPVLTVVHCIYLVYIGLAGNIGKYTWKERLVR